MRRGQTAQPGPELVARRIIEMLGVLHARAYPSLYLDAHMSPSGTAWRWAIGVIVDGRWPRRWGEELDADSVAGGLDGAPPWLAPAESAEAMAARFIAHHGAALASARAPADDYVAWYREMLARTTPGGVFVFSADYGPYCEGAFCWNEPRDFRMPMPPGYRPRV